MKPLTKRTCKKVLALALKKTEAERQAHFETGLRHVPSTAQLKIAKTLKKELEALDDASLLKLYGWMQLGKQPVAKAQALEVYARIVRREQGAFDRQRLETAIISCHALHDCFDAAFAMLGEPFSQERTIDKGD